LLCSPLVDRLAYWHDPAPAAKQAAQTAVAFSEAGCRVPAVQLTLELVTADSDSFSLILQLTARRTAPLLLSSASATTHFLALPISRSLT
jgi:hypothetical protein